MTVYRGDGFVAVHGAPLTEREADDEGLEGGEVFFAGKAAFEGGEIAFGGGSFACGGDRKGDVMASFVEVVVKVEAHPALGEGEAVIPKRRGDGGDVLGEDLSFVKEGLTALSVVDADLREREELGIKERKADVDAFIHEGEVLPFLEAETFE